MTEWLLRDRAALDAIDDQLLELLARRTALVTEIADRKGWAGMDFRDPEREAATLARWRARAEALGLDPDLAERVAREVVGAKR